MKKAAEKTNVMRILYSKKVDYKEFTYNPDATLSGKEISYILGEKPEMVFKTLVTVGKTNNHYVFLVPVEKELDLKKAASAVNEKYVEMIKSKDLLSTVGYVHGGCSPIGMKKNFVTVMDKSAEKFQSIIFSAGKIGFQVEVSIKELRKVLDFTMYDIVK